MFKWIRKLFGGKDSAPKRVASDWNHPSTRSTVATHPKPMDDAAHRRRTYGSRSPNGVYQHTNDLIPKQSSPEPQAPKSETSMPEHCPTSEEVPVPNKPLVREKPTKAKTKPKSASKSRQKARAASAAKREAAKQPKPTPKAKSKANKPVSAKGKSKSKRSTAKSDTRGMRSGI